MTTSLPAFDQLFHHENFVRQALRGLLRDPDAVDDAVQETWLRTLQHPPGARAAAGEAAEPRTWLARVAHNLAVTRWRAERRRAARERVVAAAAAAGVTEAADASQRRVEMRQQVVAAILALDEPYRSVVLLRYEAGMELGAIAARLGRSAATVRSQLSRAHDQLRARLDGEFGGRERWAGPALALVGETVVAPGVATGAGTTAGIGVAVGAALAALLLAVVWLGSHGFGSDPAPVTSTRAAAAAAPAATEPAPREEPADRAAVRQPAVPQDPKPPAALRAPVELFDRAYYDDYELATFSFEHGVRDDPDLSITRNDWDLMFGSGELDAMDPRSVVVDLGPLEPDAFGTATLPSVVPVQRTKVREGHAYFVGTNDDDTTLATVLFVRSHEPNRTCRFDWFTTDGTGRWQGSIADPGRGRAWVDRLVELRDEQRLAQGVQVLRNPSVRLQLRNGAGGGNPHRIDLTGITNQYVDVRSPQPIDVVTPPTMQERASAWSDGGSVPVGSVFVVTRIDWAGGARGDSNGRGAFRVVVGDRPVADVAPSEQAIAGSWTGRLLVQHGAERDTYFEIANSSWGEVRLTGEFVLGASRAGFGGTNAGFGRVPAPAVLPRPVLGVPEARLQVRTGQVGGNPCRVDLRGRYGMYVDRLAKEPLDFAAPLSADEHAIAFAAAGHLPAGTTFVVTNVRYTGATGDGNGRPFVIQVAGKRIFEEKGAGQAVRGEWLGELEIPAGEEMRTFVEVGNGSHADVVITGRFEQR